MHYYQFNIGDYTSHTARLSCLEDLAYRRLLDLYYLNEKPFTGSVRDIARDIGMVDHIDEVDYILNKYFPCVENEWVNKRADEEVRKYQMKRKTASKAGKASGKVRQGAVSERVLNSVDVPLNQPLTNNHKPITNSKEKDTNVSKKKAVAFRRPSIQEITEYIQSKNYPVDPERFFNYYESNGWKVGRNSMKNWKAAIGSWSTKVTSNEESKRNNGSGKVSDLARFSQRLQEDIRNESG